MVEALVVVAILISAFLLLLLLLPALARSKGGPGPITCLGNLIQIGISVRICQDDNNGKFPMNVPVAQGGTRELLAAGNVVAAFQVMSNELGMPKILICPQDSQHFAATNFAVGFGQMNLSYFLALNASESDPKSILCGDDNLIQNGRAVSPGILNLSIPPATWTSDRHHGAGNILLVDGSAQAEVRIGAPPPLGAGFATNRIVIP